MGIRHFFLGKHTSSSGKFLKARVVQQQVPAQDVPYDLILWYVLNHLIIVGIGPILSKEIEFIYQSNRSDRTYVYI